MMRRLEKIFVCQWASFNRGRLVIEPNPDEKRQTQIVLVPEFNVEDALKGDNLPNILQLFEGVGAPMQPNLFEKLPEEGGKRWAKTVFVVASNKLPFWSQPSKLNRMYEQQWLPLMTRVHMVHMERSFAGENVKFPYDENTLAQALKCLQAE